MRETSRSVTKVGLSDPLVVRGTPLFNEDKLPRRITG